MSHRLAKQLALAGALMALLPGCGSGDNGKPIPADIRSQLESRLAEAERRLNTDNAGACNDITTNTQPEVERVLESVPDDVDADVRSALDDGFARLFELTSERCDELQRQETETNTDTTETTPPPPETDTTEEPTTPTTPTETDQQPTETDQQPQNPNGNEKGNGGSGNGGGNGNSGGGGDQNGVGGDLPIPDGAGGVSPPGEG
jgi:hypothetical protein